MIDADAVVIGAGAAGLAAARSLAGRSLRVIVLEARDRTGGRVWSAPFQKAGGIGLPLRRKDRTMSTHPAISVHRLAAQHHQSAADYHELAAKRYELGDHAQAAHYALLAQAHAFHASGFMSDAAKIHAERHGGNKHAAS